MFYGDAAANTNAALVMHAVNAAGIDGSTANALVIDVVMSQIHTAFGAVSVQIVDRVGTLAGVGRPCSG